MDKILDKNSLFTTSRNVCGICILQMISIIYMCLGDLNGHVGRHVATFNGVQRRYDVGQRNLGVIMLLEFCLDK